MTIEEAVQQAQDGDTASLEFLCRQFIGLIKKTAGQPFARSIYEDAVAEGYAAFIEAVKSYRTEGAVPFAGYAQSKVRFAVWNLYKKERSHSQRECSAQCECGGAPTIMDNLADDIDVAWQVECKITAEYLLGQLDKLSAKQRQAILYTVLGGHSLIEASQCLNVTPQAVHGLKKRAIDRLREEFGDRWGIKNL